MKGRQKNSVLEKNKILCFLKGILPFKMRKMIFFPENLKKFYVSPVHLGRVERAGGFVSWCLVMVVWLFLTVPWICLHFVIVVFPDHTHLVSLGYPKHRYYLLGLMYKSYLTKKFDNSCKT